MKALSKEQLARYNRNIVMDNWGVEAQTKILNARVLVIGIGGLGSPAAFYLAAAGIGTLGIMDNDVVDLSNLQRQILHTTKDINRPKIKSAVDKLLSLNPDINIREYPNGVTPANAIDIIDKYDFVVSATDNFESKYLINDACVLSGTPFCHSGVVRYQGQIMTIVPDKSACFRCLFPSPPPKGSTPSPAEQGVLGSVAGTMGTLQATEALKYLAGVGNLLTDTLLNLDALRVEFQRIGIPKNPDCPVCGNTPEITNLSQPGLYD